MAINIQKSQARWFGLIEETPGMGTTKLRVSSGVVWGWSLRVILRVYHEGLPWGPTLRVYLEGHLEGVPWRCFVRVLHFTEPSIVTWKKTLRCTLRKTLRMTLTKHPQSTPSRYTLKVDPENDPQTSPSNYTRRMTRSLVVPVPERNQT